MSQQSPESDSQDPFSERNLAIQQFITSARIYDVLLALLKLEDAGTARDLLELHSQGMLLGSAPSFAGTFLTDEMNEDGNASDTED